MNVKESGWEALNNTLEPENENVFPPCVVNANRISQFKMFRPPSSIICKGIIDEESDSCFDNIENVSELSTNSENERDIEKKWDEGDHRAFVSQIFDLGLQNASPCLILENMQCTDPYFVTKPRIKSHLQKYRLGKARSKEEFLVDYDKCMKRGIENLNAFKHKNGGKLFMAGDKIRSFLDSEDGLGKVGAALSIACMMEDDMEENEEELELNVNDSPKKVSDLLSLNGIIKIPILTEEEQASPLGMMMRNIVECFHSIQKRLQDKKLKEMEAYDDFQEFQKDFLKGHSRQSSDAWTELEEFCSDLDMPLTELTDDLFSTPTCVGKPSNMMPFPTSLPIKNSPPVECYTTAPGRSQRLPPIQWFPPWLPLYHLNPYNAFQLPHRILKDPTHFGAWMSQDSMKRIQIENSYQKQFSFPSEKFNSERSSRLYRRHREEDEMNNPSPAKRMRHPDPNFQRQTNTASHLSVVTYQGDHSLYDAQGSSYGSKDVDQRVKINREHSFGISTCQPSHFPFPPWIQETTSNMTSHPSLSWFHSPPLNSVCITPDLGFQNAFSTHSSVSLDDDSSIIETM